ncbi:hypothetical protein [Streptococcus sp. DD13]|uniref:hypothetical protein n=1 Tax=Streptococcus sp. DD13 TaxID=1777881 RepID=UPI00079336EC|nr:hypothetical protein [Streptococcus sp. DD13]KXT79279.1 hypothetical protein STRDD13_00037 [Streptococcus sp. DD13]
MRILKSICTSWTYLLLALFGLSACSETSTRNTNNSQPKESSLASSTVEATSTSMSSSSTAPSSATAEDSTKPSTESTVESSVNITETNYIPTDLVGQWSGSNPLADAVTITIAGNGLVTTSARYQDGTQSEWRAIINSIEFVGNGTYFITSYSGDYNAFLPGTTGLGEAGYKVAFGFKIENAQLIPINWIAPETNEHFDLTNIHSFGYALSRS